MRSNAVNVFWRTDEAARRAVAIAVMAEYPSPNPAHLTPVVRPLQAWPPARAAKCRAPLVIYDAVRAMPPNDARNPPELL